MLWSDTLLISTLLHSRYTPVTTKHMFIDHVLSVTNKNMTSFRRCSFISSNLQPSFTSVCICVLVALLTFLVHEVIYDKLDSATSEASGSLLARYQLSLLVGLHWESFACSLSLLSFVYHISLRTIQQLKQKNLMPRFSSRESTKFWHFCWKSLGCTGVLNAIWRCVICFLCYSFIVFFLFYEVFLRNFCSQLFILFFSLPPFFLSALSPPFLSLCSLSPFFLSSFSPLYPLCCLAFYCLCSLLSVLCPLSTLPLVRGDMFNNHQLKATSISLLCECVHVCSINIW